MPQMGESVVEGTILTWLKKEGDSVSVDDPLVEVSTDKVDTEIPSPVAGTLTKILVAEGDTVEIGTALCEIDEGGKAAAPAAPTEEPKEEPKAEAEPAPEPEPVEAPAPPAAKAGPQEEAGQVLSPLVRRLAREHNVDVTQVRGTGAGG